MQIQADVGLYRSNIQQYKLRIQAGVGIYRLMRIDFLPFSFSSFYALLYMHPPKLRDVPNRLGQHLETIILPFSGVKEITIVQLKPLCTGHTDSTNLLGQLQGGY